ncbi:MAG: SPFH domain-containing protein [Burkholderiales bacterium]
MNLVESRLASADVVFGLPWDEPASKHIGVAGQCRSGPTFAQPMAAPVMSLPASGQAGPDDWPQVASFHIEPSLTSDGVPVIVAATIAWTRTTADRWTALTTEHAAVVTAAKARLLAVVGLSGLAELLFERPLIDGRLCRELGLVLAERGLALRTVTIDELRIDPELQAACDVRQLSAMRQCLARRRQVKLAD